MEIEHSEQVFVSDITYIKRDHGHAYLAPVTDVLPIKTTFYSVQPNNMILTKMLWQNV